MTDSKDDNVLTDDNGDATTQLHEVMADAVEDAVADPFKKEPVRGTAGEILEDAPNPVPQSRATTSGDDEDNAYDSGDDTGAFAGDKDDTRKAVQPIVPGNIFQQYASTRHAADAAARFSPKTFASNGTSEPDNPAPQQGVRLTTVAPTFGATTDAADSGDGRVVAGASATLDGNADRVLEAQIREATHAGGAGVAALQAQQASVRAPFIGVRAPMPTVVRLDPLARTPTPL